MNLLRGFFILWSLVNPDSVFDLTDGEVTYIVDKNTVLGKGSYGFVYKGSRAEGDITNDVAVKVSHSEDHDPYIKHEKDIYELINTHEHESIPKFHKYFPANENRTVVLVTELLGENIWKLLMKHNYFSVVTSMRVGLQILDAIEHLHKHNIIHFDIKDDNVAVGFNNDSKIYLLDFNMAQEYEIINETVVFKKMPLYIEFYEEANISPKIDVSKLVDMVLNFIDHKIFKNQEVIELLEEFQQTNLHSKFIYPNYEELRNILKTELDKHQNEQNFGKFDWQRN